MNEEKKVPFKWEYGEETISLQLGMYANNQRLYMTLMADTNLLNKKSKMEELGALLDKYVPASEAMRTKLKKYDKAYRELSDENTALEAELKTTQNAGREKIANKLKYGKMEQELSELHALMDNIPPEIIAAYRRHTVGLQNER